MALKRRGPDAGLLHHSDQGCTYASEDYQRILDAHGITCSMSRRGNCHDNAVIEAFFSSLKSELADRFDSCGEAKMALFDYIEVFYNQRRRHSTLGYVSPAAFERAAAVDAAVPVDAQNAPTRDLEISQRTRDSHSAHSPSSFPSKEEPTDTDPTQSTRPLNRIRATSSNPSPPLPPLHNNPDNDRPRKEGMWDAFDE